TNGCIARTRQTGRRKTAKGNVHADSQSVLARRRTRRSTTDQQTRTRRRNRRTRPTRIRQIIPAPRRHDRPNRPRQQTRQNRRRIQKVRAYPRGRPHVTLSLSKGCRRATHSLLTTNYSILYHGLETKNKTYQRSRTRLRQLDSAIRCTHPATLSVYGTWTWIRQDHRGRRRAPHRNGLRHTRRTHRLGIRHLFQPPKERAAIRIGRIGTQRLSRRHTLRIGQTNPRIHRSRERRPSREYP